MSISRTTTALFITVCSTIALAEVANSEPARVGHTVDGFEYSPMPRWENDPDERHELQDACIAMRAECGDAMDINDIQTRFGYDEYYDATGMLVGLHVTESTGCRPLDEHLLLDKRRFRRNFRKPDQPDLDNMRVSLASGVDPDHVRMVKGNYTNIDVGCY